MALVDEYVRWGRNERQWSGKTPSLYRARAVAADRWMRQQGWAGLARGRDTHWRAWWESLPASPSSRNLGRKVLCSFGPFLVATGRRKADPSIGIPSWREPRGVPRPISADQVPALLERLRRSNGPAAVGVGLMVWLGLRISEACSARWSDYDGAWLTVCGKGGHTRRVPVPEDLRDLLARWRPKCPSDVWMIPGLHGCVSDTWLRRQCADWFVGTPHQARHLLATELLSRTGDLRLVQEWLGHQSPSSTAVYSGVAPTRLAGAADLLYGT